jgi:hypothetical protein
MDERFARKSEERSETFVPICGEENFGQIKIFWQWKYWMIHYGGCFNDP